MSQVYEEIVKAIDAFDFGDYSFDMVDETKHDPDTREWIYDLAAKIQEAIAR